MQGQNIYCPDRTSVSSLLRIIKFGANIGFVYRILARLSDRYLILFCSAKILSSPLLTQAVL